MFSLIISSADVLDRILGSSPFICTRPVLGTPRAPPNKRMVGLSYDFPPNIAPAAGEQSGYIFDHNYGNTFFW